MSSNPETNPLLEIQYRIPFDRIKAEHVEPAIGELLRDANEKLEALAADAGPRTFDNTLLAYEAITERLEYAMTVVRHLESVATYPELRAAFNAVQPAVSAFQSSLLMHEGLWKAVQSYSRTAEAAGLTGARRRFLKKTLDDFRRHGAELDAAGKARLAAIDVELATSTTHFGEHVLDATNDYELVIEDESKLAGLPPTAVAAARQSAEGKGLAGWRFTLQAPSYLPLMTYLDDAASREKLYRAYSVRATSGERDNRALIVRILELRREKAQLLGFADFADLVIDDRMAHTGARAQQFLDDLRARTEASFAAEKRSLREFRQSLEGAGAPELEPWDVAYYSEKQRAALYDFDEEALRPYFPLERVVNGMFELFGRLFGITVAPEPGVPVWDPQVRCYTIRDEAGGEILGSFYADFYPRENKRGGAWMDAFLTGLPGIKPHLGLICGNLTPPVGDKPALLTHREVETIFHEFGHLLHHLLSRVEVRSLAGTNVPWDFVELPSQIMENWCWERQSLDLFARNYETGELIPEDLFQKMKKARTFRAASAQMRQLSFGLLDLALHRTYSPARNGDVMDYARKMLQPMSPAPLPADYAMLAGFTHLFASPVGYGAGYYSYKWAEVLDADAFTRFRREGVFSRETGREFRDRILSRGNSEDPAELYRSFMGRDPDLNALLERTGLRTS
ncbi:MAG TPA: M3 family metallopeptidase [Bryobacteraceae bacterium]|jgi:oligopeptidase A|nr:M3 family metallopeptidase [Bryobacteraceae bacterium]